MSVVNEIEVRFTADTAPLQSGATRASAALDGVAAAGKRTDTALATVGRAHTTVAKQSAATSSALNTVRSSMTTMAASALQSAPGVAQLGSVIGSLAIGSGMMVGVLAGMTALALAWDKITASARDAEKAQEEALKRAEALGLTPAAQAAQRKTDNQGFAAQQQQVAQDLVRARGVLKAAMNPPDGADPLGASLALRSAQKEVDRLSAEFNRLGRAITLNAQAIDAFQTAANPVRTATATVSAGANAARDTLRQLEALDQQNASRRSTFRTPLGEMRIGAPTAPGMVALGGVVVPNAGDQNAGLTGGGASAASQALSMVTDSAMGLVSSFSPLSLLSVAIGSAFEVMQPAIDALLMPIRALGELVGGVLNTAISYFAQGLGMVIKAIGWLVDKVNLFGGDGGLKKFGQEMIDGAKAARAGAKATEQLTAAVTGAANSITNNPEIFDWAVRRRQAGMVGGGGGMLPGGGTGGAGGHTGVTVHLHNPPVNMDTERVVQQVTRGIVESVRRGGISELSLGIRSLTPATL